MVTATDSPAPVGAEIWSNRPAVVISNNVLNRSSDAVMVVYLSSSAAKTASPTHIELTPVGRAARSIALCEQVHTVDRSRLSHRMGAVENEQMQAISDAVHLSTGMNERVNGNRAVYKWDMTVRKHGIHLDSTPTDLSENEMLTLMREKLEQVTQQRDAYHTLWQINMSSDEETTAA